MPTYTRKNEDTDPKPILSQEVDDKASLVNPTPAMSGEQLDDYAKTLLFMSEPVEVMIQPSHDPEDTTRLVTVSVNGKSFYFLRGEWRKCPRYVLEVIATAKHQAWNFGYKQASNGVTVQTQDSSQLLRYPHQWRDTNPKGQAWYESIRNTIR
jgi:hypothetical protein